MTPEQFQLFAEPLPEPMLLLAGDGMILASNRAVGERLGISVSSLQGKRLSGIVSETPDEVSRYLQLCCRSRSLVLGAMRLHTDGGVETDCRLEGSVLCPKRDGAAAVLMVRLMPKEPAADQFVALNQRIEELRGEVQRRKRAEAEIRLREEWLQVTLDSIGDGVICTDVHGRVTMVNPVAEFLTGWTQQQARGQALTTVFPIINEQSRKTVENPVDKVLRDGSIVGLANHTLLVCRDGTERPIDDSAAPIRDEAGEMLGVVLIFRDVTESRRADRELRSSEARKSAILDTALDCIITMDHEGKVIEFNPAAEKTFEYDRAEAIGRELAALIIPPSLQERHRQGLAHYLATGEGPVLGRRLELTAVRSDGSELPVELAITRIPTEGPPLFTAYLRDISVRQRGEQHRNARLAATQALSLAAGTEDAISGILRAVCENLGWDVGFFWAVNQSQTALVCTTEWHPPDLTITDFESASFSRTFEKGTGLPGHVWASGKPHWMLDVVSDPGFPRAAYAAKYGLHSAFACPVPVGDRVLGVIEFFTKRSREPDPDLLEMMGSVAGYLGQFIQRRRAEEEWRASAARLSLALSAADLGDWKWESASDIVTFSDRAAEAFGIPPGSHMTWNALQEMVHPDDLERVRMETERSIAGHIQYDIQYRVNRMDGSQIWVGIMGRAIYDASEQVIGMYGVIQDINDRKKLEESLRSSEERLRLALEAGRMGVWDWNIRTGDLNWSDSLEPLHGLAPGTFGGTMEHFRQLIHPDDRDMVNTAIQEAVESGNEFYVEFRNRRPNGGIHWIAGSGKVFPGDDGQPLRMIGIGLDVSQRKRAEQTARFLADASAALSVLVDFDSTLQKISALAVPSFADWAAVDVAEADGSLRRLSVSHADPAKVQLGHEIHRRYPPDPEAPQGAWNILRTGKSEIVPEITDDFLVESANDDDMLAILRELGLRSYIGVPLTVRGRTLAVITFVNSESDHCYDEIDLAVAEDLVSRAAIAIENSQLYRELRNADQRKDEFLATLAHELRNPLAPISNGLQAMRLAGSENDATAETRSMMERQLNLMIRLVDDLLDVSRITRDKLDLKKQRVEMSAVLHSAVETSRPLIEQAGHSITVTLPPTPIHLDADPTRLAQVFSNLLTNSAKYTPPHGQIRLIAEAYDGEVSVRVWDNGLGIPAESLPGIFQMFSQVERNMEGAQGGLGIGLSLVRRLVEMHGGTVDARSDGPGHGSEFTVRLPIPAPSHLTASRRGEEGLEAATRRRILVVDDNQDSAISLARLLNLLGHDIKTAHDGLAAVEVAAQFLPDVILLDIGLPKLNGYDACRRIREQPWSRNMEIVALTGWGQEEDRRRSKEAGFDHHMVKPVDLPILKKLLANPTARSPS